MYCKYIHRDAAQVFRLRIAMRWPSEMYGYHVKAVTVIKRQQIRLLEKQHSTKESHELATQTVHQRPCYTCRQIGHIAENCHSQRLMSKHQKTATAVSASTDGVREAAVALDGSSKESRSRLAESEAPDQPQNGIYHSTRRKGNVRTSRRIGEHIIPMQWTAAELAHWQQRDAVILPILIIIKSKHMLSATEIEKLSDTSKCLLVDIKRLVLMDNVLYHIWYNNRGEEENYQLVTPHQTREVVLKSAHPCKSVTTSGYLVRQFMLDRVRPNFYWPRLLTDIKKFCQVCSTCRREESQSADDV